MIYEEFIEETKNVVATAAISLAREKELSPEDWDLLWDLISEDAELTDFVQWVIATEVAEQWLGVDPQEEFERCNDIADAIFSKIVDQTMPEAFGRVQLQ